jgi:hypothetical protein
MKFQQVFAALIAWSFSIPTAHAIECVVSGPRYGLSSDVVDWSIKIGRDQGCIRGLRFSNVVIESLKLVSPPQTGQVTLQGPSFIYSAKSEFEGEDSFTLAVSGAINKFRGSSTIRVRIYVGSPVSAAIRHDRSPAPIATPKPLDAPADHNLPLPADGSLPPCPIWDWSRGSPPPMRPPFDRSKLYCPPPPFKPPSPTIGCRCDI